MLLFNLMIRFALRFRLLLGLAAFIFLLLGNILFLPQTANAAERFKFTDHNGRQIEYHANFSSIGSGSSPDEIYEYIGETEQPYRYKGISGGGVDWEIQIFYDETGNRPVDAMHDVPHIRPDRTLARRITVQGTSTFYVAFPNPPSNLDASVENREQAEAEASATESEEPETEEDVPCENQGFIMGWLACPLGKIAGGIIEWVDEQIISLLTANVETYGNESVKDAWATIRNIAYFILVPLMLIMVIGTALGFELVSSYTVKKILPRIFVAAIFISLSYYISVFLIEFSNSLGRGAFGILTTPFGSDVHDMKLQNLMGPSFANSAAGLVIAGVAGAWLVYLFLSPIVLFIVLAFLVLVLREIFIVLFLLIAPLAILAWILPAGARLWKMWWLSFTKLLLMFPIIMGMIAVGRIFAYIVQQGGDIGVGGALNPFIKLTAYTLPYAFIPFTFKLAGGTFATLATSIDGLRKGELYKKSQYQKRQEKKQRMKNENVFGGDSWLAEKGNKLATWSAAPRKNFAYSQRHGRIPWVSAAGRRIHAGIEESSIGESEKLAQKLDLNDKGYRTLSGIHGGLKGNVTYKGRRMTTGEAFKEAGIYGQALTTERDIRKAAGIMATSDSDTEVLAAAKLMRAAPVIAGRHMDPELQYADVAAAGMLGLASHGFFGSEDVEQGAEVIMGEGQKDKTKLAYADRVLTRAAVIGARSRPDLKAGYGHVIKKGRIVNGMSDEGGRAYDLLGTLGQGDVTQSKGTFLKAMGGKIKEIIRAGTYPGGMEAAAASWRESGLSEGEINKRLQVVREKSDVFRDGLLQAAGKYSYAPADTIATARQMIREMGLDSELQGRDAEAELVRLAQEQSGGAQPKGDSPAPGGPGAE